MKLSSLFRWLPAGRNVVAWTVIALSVLVVALTTSPSALAASEAQCVRILSRGPDAYAVTLAAGCDLRSVARVLPQRDTKTGAALPIVEQLRSIYTFNEQAATDGKAPRTVRRGCVPGNPPATSTPEELEACPHGVANYYGIASVGNQAVIYVPRSRASSLAERLDALGRATCGTVAGLNEAYANDSLVPGSVKRTLTACSEQFGPSIAAVRVEVAPETKATVGALTLDPTLERRLTELEQGRAALLASAASQRQEASIAIALLGATILALLALNAFMWNRVRRARIELAKRRSTNSNELAQVIVQLKQEFKSKLASATKSHGTQLREQIAAMHAVEREYEEAMEFSRNATEERIAKRDMVIADLEQSTKALSQQAQQALSRAAKAEKQSAKLRARLRIAKTGNVGGSLQQPDGGTLLPVS